MNYRSYSDLSYDIISNQYKIPQNIDLIVGIPRSGMLAGSILALHLNKKICDLESFISNMPISTGRTRKISGGTFTLPHEAMNILLLDDSVYSGISITEAKEKILKNTNHKKITTCVVYATNASIGLVDIHLKILETPRIFQWNLMHRTSLIECCVDIDGVLCHDPTNLENDDAENYKHFILNAQPLAIPTYPVGHLVTSRLEKYRKETELWLKNHNIIYKKLHMLDLPDANIRRHLKCHAEFKSHVYSTLFETSFFIESCNNQAKQINLKTGKPVLCYNEQIVYNN